MNVAEVVALVVGSLAFSEAVKYLLVGRRTVRLDEFKTITTELRKDVDGLKRSLKEEESEHAKTRELLRVALRHIRDVIAWGQGDRKRPLPEPPDELVREL